MDAIPELKPQADELRGHRDLFQISGIELDTEGHVKSIGCDQV